MTHDELLAKIEEQVARYKRAADFSSETLDTESLDKAHNNMQPWVALRAVLQIKDRPRYSDTKDDRLRSEVWNQAMFAVRETISERLK